MPTPPLSREIAERAVAEVEQCLREGYSPTGVTGPKGSAREEAARRLVRLKLMNSRYSIGSRLAAAERLGITPDWSLYQQAKPRFRVRAGSAPVAAPPAPTLMAPEADSDIEVRKLRATLASLRAEVNALRKADLDTHIVRESIFGLAQTTPDPPTWVIDTHASDGGPRVPMTLWSDWHWGEVVRPEEIGGVNEFNLAVAHERARRLVEKIIHLSFDHAVRPEYPGIVVMLGGDMISGEIHDELTETNEVRTAPALIDLQGVLIEALSHMADRFGRVFVPCVVGNHGRMTHKPRAKGRVHTSFEWLLYCQLERHFSDDPRITFMIPGEADAHFRVAGQRVMLTHGDSLGTRGGDGMIGPLGPILRGIIKTRNSEAQIGRDFDFCCMGHWHQFMPLHDRGFVVNGALKGFDEYARLYLRARYERPIQGLWFMDPRVGVQSVWPIYLEPLRTATPATDVFSFAA